MMDSFLLQQILGGGYLSPELVAYLRLGGDYCFSVGNKSIDGRWEDRRLYVDSQEIATFSVSFESAWGPGDCLEYRMRIVDFTLGEAPWVIAV